MRWGQTQQPTGGNHFTNAFGQLTQYLKHGQQISRLLALTLFGKKKKKTSGKKSTGENITKERDFILLIVNMESLALLDSSTAGYHVSTEVSLGVVATTLTAGVLLSLMKKSDQNQMKNLSSGFVIVFC